jgi:hypothetical protein
MDQSRHAVPDRSRSGWRGACDGVSVPSTALDFGMLLTTIIDSHREAERTRRLWARIWWILGVSIGVFVIAASASLNLP